MHKTFASKIWMHDMFSMQQFTAYRQHHINSATGWLKSRPSYSVYSWSRSSAALTSGQPNDRPDRQRDRQKKCPNVAFYWTWPLPVFNVLPFVTFYCSHYCVMCIHWIQSQLPLASLHSRVVRGLSKLSSFVTTLWICRHCTHTGHRTG